MWTTLVLVATAWVVGRVAHVGQDSFSEVESVLENPLTTSRSEIGAWAGAQRDRVAMAAQLSEAALRVIEPGNMSVGDPVVVVSRPTD